MVPVLRCSTPQSWGLPLSRDGAYQPANTCISARRVTKAPLPRILPTAQLRYGVGQPAHSDRQYGRYAVGQPSGVRAGLRPVRSANQRVVCRAAAQPLGDSPSAVPQKASLPEQCWTWSPAVAAGAVAAMPTPAGKLYITKSRAAF